MTDVTYTHELPPAFNKGRRRRTDIDALYEAARQKPGVWAGIYFKAKPLYIRAAAAARHRVDKGGPLYGSGVETAARTLDEGHYGVFVRYPDDA